MKTTRSNAAREWFQSPEDGKTTAPFVPSSVARVVFTKADAEPNVEIIDHGADVFTFAPEPAEEPTGLLDETDEPTLPRFQMHRSLVRSAAIVGAVSAAGLLVLVDQFLRNPAQAAQEMVAIVPVAAPAPAAVALPAPPQPAAEPADEAVEAPSSDAAAQDSGARRLPFTVSAPRAAARPHGKAAGHLRVADEQLRDGLFGWALWNYREASRLAPADVDARFGMALAATELYRDGLARASVEKALEIDPRHPQAHLLSGYLAQMRGDAAQARTQYDQYLQLDAGGPFAPQVQAILAGPLAH